MGLILLLALLVIPSPFGLAANPPYVVLQWTASTSSVAGYNVYRGTQSGGPYTKLNTSVVTGTTYTDASVQGGATYYYVTTSVSGGGMESADSNQAEAVLPAASATSQLSASPSSIAFGNVALGSSQTSTMTLTDSGTASITISEVSVTGAGFEISGLSVPLNLAAGESVSFNASFDPTVAGTASGEISLASNASNSPSAVALSGSGTSAAASVALAWTASTSPNISGYNVYRGTVSGGPYSRLNSSLVAATDYVDAAVQAGQTYYYVTTAVNIAGAESAYSNQASATTPSSGGGTTLQIAAKPTRLSFGTVTIGGNSILPIIVTNTGTGSVTISQASIGGTGFRLSAPGLPFSLAAGQNSSFSVTFAPKVSGSTTGTVSLVSNAADSPLREPLSGTGANPHSVALAWTASTSGGVAGYNVYRSMTSGGPYTKLNSRPVAQTSYSDTSVEAKKTYYYVTTAVGSSGIESAHSNQAEALIPSP